MGKDKKVGVQITEVDPENIQEMFDQFSDVFGSENVIGFGYGSADGGDVWVDLASGDVEITYPDQSVEKIAGTDPRAQSYWDPFGYGNE